ncbi:MAG: glycosyl hydrolase-related protein, partial [Eubacteriales bacterium]
KFEVVNHKWTDVSENRYGIALLNDCKYGISGERDENDGVDIRLSLHKSGTHPDVTGDAGVHELTYSLLPHEGAFSVPAVTSEAYLMNIKPVAVYGKSDIAVIATVGEDNIILETVKPAEDDCGSCVLRLYEAERARTSCAVALAGAKRAYLTNMLEDKLSELEIKDGKITIDFKPFEIKTILVER